MTEMKDTQTTVNDSRTQAEFGTKLTHACSGFGLEDIRRDVIALRVGFGAHTRMGQRCSNLVEQLDNYRLARGEQKLQLERLIRRSMAELQANQ